MQTNSFKYVMPTRVLFGVGVRKQIKECLQNNNFKNIGIIVDSGLKDVVMVQSLIKELEENCRRVKVGYCEISEPTYLSLDQKRDQFCHDEMQLVMGIGGGSAIDMAKAMAVLTHNKGPAISYRGFDKMTDPVLPIIAVPTTAGTGSEVTPNASFIDTIENKKMGINGEVVRPAHAFLDPELTISCPRAPTISAGVDSLVHSIEAFVAKKTNVLARHFAQEGFKRVAHALPCLIEAYDDIALRTEVMYGAFLSGVGLMHSGTGPAAAMSYPLGVRHKVPHGIGGGIFLPHVVEMNINRGYYEYGELMMGVNDKHGAIAFVEFLKETFSRLGIDQSLKIYNITRKEFVQDTLALSGALEQNPVPFGEDEINVILDVLGV